MIRRWQGCGSEPGTQRRMKSIQDSRAWYPTDGDKKKVTVQHTATVRDVARERRLEFRYIENTSGEAGGRCTWQCTCQHWGI